MVSKVLYHLATHAPDCWSTYHALVLPVMLRYMHSDLHTGTPSDDQGQIVCVETARGHKRIYRRLDRHGEGGDGFNVTDDKVNTACRPHT